MSNALAIVCPAVAALVAYAALLVSDDSTTKLLCLIAEWLCVVAFYAACGAERNGSG